MQESLKKFTGSKTWQLTLYKNSDDTWGFNIPYLLTFNEKFINGTEKCLDYWFETLIGYTPVIGSKMSLFISSQEITDPTTTIQFIGDDDFESFFNSDLKPIDKPSYYLDQKSGYTIWLCQYLQFLFQEKPQKMYLKLVPIE
jgi:hypothetical protein